MYPPSSVCVCVSVCACACACVCAVRSHLCVSTSRKGLWDRPSLSPVCVSWAGDWALAGCTSPARRSFALSAAPLDCGEPSLFSSGRRGELSWRLGDTELRRLPVDPPRGSEPDISPSSDKASPKDPTLATWWEKGGSPLGVRCRDSSLLASDSLSCEWSRTGRRSSEPDSEPDSASEFSGCSVIVSNSP